MFCARRAWPPHLVACFEAFYCSLTRRFRYGQREGAPWQATNGLAQGCPASPDLLNILLEPFHRWALAAGLGVEVSSGCRVPSVSFADDVALVAENKEGLEQLIAAYLEWCSLLGVKVTKVQAWTNLPGVHSVLAGGLDTVTSPTFRMVGVVFGANDRLATQAHFGPRLEKALHTVRRLRALTLPASITALLWRTTVLPQALYGCEVRNITPQQLTPLSRAGQAAVAAQFPLFLNTWRAPEVLMGPPLGQIAVLDPILEVRFRQLRWLQLVVNSPSLAGLVHRHVAWDGLTMKEPTPALSAALQAVGWQLRRNTSCLRSSAWPILSPESSYPGPISLQPVDHFPPSMPLSLMGPSGASVGRPLSSSTAPPLLPCASATPAAAHTAS